MYPYTTLYVAAERARDMQQQAAAERRARAARRARRGPGPVAAGRAYARRPGAPRWA